MATTPQIEVLSASVAEIDRDALDADEMANDVATFGEGVIRLDGEDKAIHFLVVTDNVYTGEDLSERTPVCVFLSDESGNGDNPRLPDEIEDAKEEIEAALKKHPAVRASMAEVECARDAILKM